MRYFNKIAAAAAVAVFGFAGAAHADWCENEVRGQVDNQLNVVFNQETAEVRDYMNFLETKGKTNSQMYQQLSQALNQAYGQLQAQSQQAIANGTQQCRQGIEPYQIAMDAYVANLTGGLSLVLPKNMTHIDMGEILDGNILGGENSFFRKNLGIKW